jgi:hypothetical protein
MATAEWTRHAPIAPHAPNVSHRAASPGALGNQSHLRRLAVREQPLQARLTIGAVDDPLEQEADAAADRVMRMADPLVSLSSAPPRLSRKCAECEEGDEKGEPLLRRAAAAGGGMDGAAAPPIVQDVLNSPGQPLDSATHEFMASRFGADFADVRIHTDARAARSAAAVGALAYTVGRDLVFGAGQFQPGEQRGRHLLAHELAHVVQQGGATGVVQRLIREPYPWQGVITPAIGAHVRSAPNSSDPSNIVDSIPAGERVTVTSATGNWLRIQSRYRGPLLEGYIYHHLVDDAASHEMAGSVGTTMVWEGSGPGSGTDFESWASAPTEAPFPAVTATTVMNCWEAVLLSAYRARAISWRWIHNLYTATPVRDWVTTMSRGSLHNYAVPGPNLPMPQRGDLVFFNGIDHVALATGSGSDVYTFWPPPNTAFALVGGTTDQVKVSTIEALANWWPTSGRPPPTIQFGSPAW